MSLSRAQIEAIVTKRGLGLLGIVGVDEETSFEKYQRWLAEGKHAGMHYMTEHQEVRRSPKNLLSGANAAMVIGMKYFQGQEPYRKFSAPKVAQYARFRDYHKTLRQKGEEILDEVLQSEPNAVGRVVVDTAPILEKPLAAQTPQGFIGKNSLYIHPQYGSFLLLAEVITSLKLPIDDAPTPHKDESCGSCKRCQMHCPTGALDAPFTLDANKCLSYWTIEHRGTVPFQFWPWFRYYYFGCDICQMVCPFNRALPAATAEQTFVPPPLDEIALMDQSFYERTFGGTPMTRAKREGLRRNALIAMVVTRHAELPRVLNAMANEESPVLAETVKQAYDWLELRSV